MPTTRNFSSLGIWANDAETVIPMTPVEGVAYRNDTLTQMQNEAGEGYDTKPNSADFNQKMFIVTSFTDEMDSHGIVGWSDEVDYELPAITWSTNGFFYTALQASGPSGVGFKDPDTEPTYWELIFGSSQFELDLSSQVLGDEGARLVGTTYQPDPLLPVVGQTAQSSLELMNKQSYRLHGLEVNLSGKFDENGVLLSSGFNIKDNVAEKVTQNGYSYFRITLADDPFSIDKLEQGRYFVSAERVVDPGNPANLLTANVFMIIGEWERTDGFVVDGTNSIKINFSNPFNLNEQIFVPFSITGLFNQLGNNEVRAPT